MASITMDQGRNRKGFFDNIRSLFQTSTSLDTHLSKFGVQGYASLVSNNAIKKREDKNPSVASEIKSRFADLASRSWNTSKMEMSQWKNFLSNNFMDIIVQASSSMKKSVFYVHDQISNTFIPASHISPKLQKGLQKGIGKDISAKMKNPTNMPTKHEQNCSQLWKANVRDNVLKNYKSLGMLLEAVVGNQFKDMEKGRPVGFVVSNNHSYFGYTDTTKSYGLFCENKREETREHLIDKALKFSSGREKISQALRVEFGYDVDKNTSPSKLSSLMKNIINYKVPSNMDELSKLPKGDYWRKSVEHIDNPIMINNKLKREFNGRVDRLLRNWFVFDDKMTPKTPVLIKDSAILRLDKVNSNLSAENLQRNIGSSYTQFMENLEKSKSRKDDNVVEVEFNQDQINTHNGLKNGQVVENESAFGGINFVSNNKTNHATNHNGLLVTFDGEDYSNLAVRKWNGSEQHEIFQYSDMKSLPNGKYPVVLNDFEGPDMKIAEVEISNGKEPVFHYEGQKINQTRFISALEAQDIYKNTLMDVSEKLVQREEDNKNKNREHQNDIVAQMGELIPESDRKFGG